MFIYYISRIVLFTTRLQFKMKICRSPTFSAAKHENGRESFAARASPLKNSKRLCADVPPQKGTFRKYINGVQAGRAVFGFLARRFGRLRFARTAPKRPQAPRQMCQLTDIPYVRKKRWVSENQLTERTRFETSYCGRHTYTRNGTILRVNKVPHVQKLATHWNLVK